MTKKMRSLRLKMWPHGISNFMLMMSILRLNGVQETDRYRFCRRMIDWKILLMRSVEWVAFWQHRGKVAAGLF